jgi:hypothetical protein
MSRRDPAKQVPLTLRLFDHGDSVDDQRVEILISAESIELFPLLRAIGAGGGFKANGEGGIRTHEAV